MSSNPETISFSLELNVADTQASLRKFQTVLYRTIGIIQRMGLDPDAEAFMQKVQELIAWTNRLRLALVALNTLRMASGDPFAWAMMGITAWEFGYETGELIQRMG